MGTLVRSVIYSTNFVEWLMCIIRKRGVTI
jgi:hypothetical protein